MDSWSEEVPFPNPRPYGTYRRTPGASKSNGGFMEFGPVPNNREKDLADTIRAKWAVERLSKKYDEPFFLAMGLYAPHFPNYCPQKIF